MEIGKFAQRRQNYRAMSVARRQNPEAMKTQAALWHGRKLDEAAIGAIGVEEGEGRIIELPADAAEFT